MPIKVGVTSGIYAVARSEELATPVKKLGYTITRGASAMEIAADVAHEIPYTHGLDMRHIAKKQGVDILFHGDLTVPMELPERSEWRDAHDRMCKSVRSAVYAGAKYIDFHASLNIWLELMTYAGRKLMSSFVDSEGRFILHIMKECQPLREWFVETRLDSYGRDLLTNEELRLLNNIERQKQRELDEILERERTRLSQALSNKEITLDEFQKKIDEVRKREIGRIQNEILEVNRLPLKKLERGEAWASEEFRGTETLDGYHIMAHYLFYTKDPIWMEMANIYSNVLSRYGLNYNDRMWLEKAWRSAENNNDKEFKEFFYAVVGAKYLEGHIKKTFEWMNKDFRKELATHPDGKELQEIANKLVIAIENPDARDPSHAGMYILWRLKQIYAAVKTTRRTLKTNRVAIIIDHEHIASQGHDAWLEVAETAKQIPDYGTLVISIHSNHPNPLHPHEPIEFGDVKLYELLHTWRRTGFGKNGLAYLIFERGGGEDPFKRSVEALKLMATYLEKDTEPKNLPLEFFGIKGPVSGMMERQLQIIRDHAYEPLKDLLDMPEEEWGILSAEARRKGRAEVWKKAEMR